MIIDTLNSFHLVDDFTFAETIVYNYATRYPTRSSIFGYAHKFLSPSQAKIAYKSLIEQGYIVEHDNYSVTILTPLKRNIVPIIVQPKAGRPLRPKKPTPPTNTP